MIRTRQIFLLLALLLPSFILANGFSIKEHGDQKPGQCPPQRYYFKNTTNNRCAKLCTNDYYCKSNWKCCNDNCDMICKPPAEERPGQCPTLDSASSAPRCNDYCTSDSECKLNHKCCMSRCGRTCVPLTTESTTRQGFCLQEEPYICGMKDREFCDEASCLDGHKCCNFICRKECLSALKERAGECPAAETPCPSGAENKVCTSDYECTGYHKCCPTKCGQRCLMMPKPKIPYNLRIVTRPSGRK